MSTSWLPFRFSYSLLAAILVLSGSLNSIQADEEVEDNEEPINASAPYTVPGDDDDQPASGRPKTGKLVLPSGGIYHSKKLKGDFMGQPMYVTINGTSYPFWGVRAVALDQDSPLRELNYRDRNGKIVRFTVGDVISRLDDRKLDIGKFKKGKVWQIPELENHYGITEVRWIKQRQDQVNIGEMEIDSTSSGNSGNSGQTPVKP